MRKIIMTALTCSAAGLLTASASVTVEAWYRLGENGATESFTPKDSSGNARDFLIDNGGSFFGVSYLSKNPAPGSTEYASFNGDVTGYSDIGWDPPENNVGVECWARSNDLAFDTFNSLGTVVFGTGHNQNGIGILYNDFGAGFVGVIGNVNYVGLPYLPASTNEWVHLAVVRDNGVTTFYVNGVARSPVRTDNVNDSTVPFMGYTTVSGKTNYNGAIDEARIFTFKPGEFYPKDLMFFQSTNTAPYITTFKGALTGFLIRLQDKATTVNAGSIAVKLDGNVVTTDNSQAGGLTTINYTSPTYLASGSSHAVNLVFTDSGGVSQTNDLTFVVAPYASVPAELAMADGTVDKTKPGFRLRPYQTDGTAAAGQQPNSLAWTEDQVIGLHGDNVADLTSADAKGFIDLPGTVNLSIEAGSGTERGNFVGDQAIPGIPGTLGTTGNASFELITFLEFPAAGVYQMGVNSDDGFKVTTGRNPRDRFALVLGQFDGGRGASDTLFTITIPAKGIYPFRLLWENGNGELPDNQANCEWFTVLADGTKVLINDAASTVKAYRSAPLPPFICRVVPGIGERGVLPASGIQVDITDDTTQVNGSTIMLGLNGGALGNPTSVSKVGSVTSAILTPASPFPVNSLNTAQVAWADTGSYSTTNSWEFTTLSASLPLEVRTPIGSGDSNKRGFRVHTWQIAKFTANGTANSGIVNEVPVGNSLFLGVWGENIADLSSAENGEFNATLPNWNRNAEQGTDIGLFQSPDYPDLPIPGIPGSTGGYEDLAVEALTYIEFPTSGVYTMGVNSDDGFRVTVAESASPGAGAVHVTAPASKAGNYCGLATYAANGGAFGGPWPRTPALVRPAVRADDGSTTSDADGVNVGDSYMFLINRPTNVTELAGNIAIVRRGGGIAFAQKVRYCQDAGALAVIVVNRADQAGQKPWGMGGSDPGVTIPCIMIDWSDWAKLKDAATTSAANTITVSLTDDDSPMLGQFDGGRGSGTPSLFSFYVPQAGLYPFRLMWEQGQGGADCEWFSLDNQGNSVLLNDANNSKALKAYRARTAPVTPVITSITLNGANVTVAYTGVLQQATAVTGPWSDVNGASSPSYTTSVADSARKFYRARQ